MCVFMSDFLSSVLLQSRFSKKKANYEQLAGSLFSGFWRSEKARNQRQSSVPYLLEDKIS